MKDRKKPAIRFKGFTEDWEQRKLGDIFKEYSEKYREELPALMIIQGGGTMPRDESDRSLLYDKANLANYKMVKEGDFIVHLRSFEGGLEKATNTGIISPAYHTLHGENTDSRFYYSYFRSKKFIDVDLKPHVYGIRDGRSIDIEGMKTVKIPFTNYREQKTIGTFIKQLDHLITLHQRKYDKLVKIKKSMLEKMFPRDGKIVPDIRFSGFTEDWEQRKLGDCFTERVESMPDGELISVTIKDGIKKFFELGRHDNSNDDKSKYKKVCVGDIAYNSMRMWQGASGYSPYEGIVSPAYTVISPNSGINSKCLAYQFKLPEMIRTFQVNSQGITSDNWNLKYPALSQIEIFVSKDEEEQTQIAEYFVNLDHLITLHHRKHKFLLRLNDYFFKAIVKITWEQRKVREIADRYDNLRVPVAASIRIPGTTPYYGANGIQDYVEGYTHEGEFVLVAEDGANDLINYPVKCVNGRIWVNNHAHVIQGKDIIANNQFLAYSINHADIENLLVGGSRAKLNAETLMDIELTIPSVIEQQEIGSYLKSLDHLITLHQRKLEKLKNIKKSCLGKMFI